MSELSGQKCRNIPVKTTGIFENIIRLPSGPHDKEVYVDKRERLAILMAAQRASSISGGGVSFSVSFQVPEVTVQREYAGKITHRFRIPFQAWALHFFSTYEELMKDCPGEEFTVEKFLKLYSEGDYEAIAFFYERLAAAHQEAIEQLIRELHQKIQEN
jgi:hypothetical protein